MVRGKSFLTPVDLGRGGGIFGSRRTDIFLVQSIFGKEKQRPVRPRRLPREPTACAVSTHHPSQRGPRLYLAQRQPGNASYC
jgi:hypothetical protein